MASEILGRVAVLHKGAYNASTAYTQLDEVSFQGSTYRCTSACTGVAPTNTSKWLLVSSKGEKGDKGDKGDTGAAGAKGDKGDKGDTGAKGEPGESFSGTLSINASTGELVLTS